MVLPAPLVPPLGGGILTANAEKMPWAKYDSSTKTLTFYYSDRTEEMASGEYPITSDESPKWTSITNNITKVVFDESFAQARPTTCSKWFYNGNNIESVLGIQYLNTSEVTDMSSMFQGCSSLTKLDLSSFNTENVTTMYKMFFGCYALTKLNLSSFVTSKVTIMSYMFENCKALTEINLSSFDTSNVISMYRMFYNCLKLISLDLSSFDTSKVENMGYMFKNCEALTDILASNKFTTDKVTYSDSMFDGCASLTGYDATKTDKTYATLDNGYLTDIQKYIRPWVKFADGTLTFQHSYKKTINSENGEYELNALDDRGKSSTPGWLENRSNVTKVVFDESFAEARPTTCVSWFFYITNIKTIEGIQYLNTSEVTDMGKMFYCCQQLTDLDLSKFDTQNVKNMSNMFSGCAAFTNLDLSNFITENVTDMSEMFDGCAALTMLKLSTFDTQNVKNMSNMFSGCAALTELNLSNFYTSKAEKMGHMFMNCSKLTKLNLSNFNTAKVANMSYMFSGCAALTDINISSFDTQNVTDMSYMFSGCAALTTLDLSTFNTQNVKDMSYMFYRCPELKSIYLGAGFKRVRTQALFSTDSPIVYSLPSNYATNKTDLNDVTVKPYVPINSQSEYGTICVPLGSKLTTDSYTGFDKLYHVAAADADKGTITLAEATSIEPGVAYVYHRALAADADKSIITFEADHDATAATDPANNGNLLKGTFERITAPGGSYILQTDGNFHPVAADNTTLAVGAYRAYLDLGQSLQAQSLRFVFGDATGIGNVNTDNANQPKAYFDLSGRKVANPQRGGIYIYNGRKIVY